MSTERDGKGTRKDRSLFVAATNQLADCVYSTDDEPRTTPGESRLPREPTGAESWIELAAGARREGGNRNKERPTHSLACGRSVRNQSESRCVGSSPPPRGSPTNKTDRRLAWTAGPTAAVFSVDATVCWNLTTSRVPPRLPGTWSSRQSGRPYNRTNTTGGMRTTTVWSSTNRNSRLIYIGP